MVGRIFIHTTQEVKAALYDLAEREARDPRRLAALIIRRELERLGLLAPDILCTQSEAEAAHD